MRSQNKNTLKILLIFIVLILIISNSKIKSNPFRTNMADIGAPALGSVNSIFSTLRKIMPFSSLREENKGLKARIDLLDRKLEEANAVQDENKRLRTLLNFAKAIPYSNIPAQVIGRDPSNWSNSLIIDKGSRHGIRQGKAVLSTRGLVGRLVEAGKTSAKVLLISDPNSKVGVMVLRNRHGGILVGRPDGACKIIYIALDSDVKIGDRVMTAGFGSAFPKGILVGDIVEVGKEPGRLYKYAIVEPSQDLSKLEEVLCIK